MTTNNTQAQPMSKATAEAMNDYAQDHLEHFQALPMDFEYEGKMYDYDSILANLDDNTKRLHDESLEADLALVVKG